MERWFSIWGTQNLVYSKTSWINQNETQEPLEPTSGSDPHTHEDSSPNWGAGMPETSSVFSLTGQNHINKLSNFMELSTTREATRC
jgi:hypothetical protein